ncbi:hypothetical protein [Pseudomonas sp. FW306-1C-G01A]|uniref:hypothetical protein n=1 Tax=Pseudomonas sp. FW306-1C-G01A TaxID=2070609 RepID=UPI0035314DBA
MRLILAVFLMLSGYAYAGCANISDSDQRNYCNAKSGNGSCANINNSDLRNACNAETGSGSGSGSAVAPTSMTVTSATTVMPK